MKEEKQKKWLYASRTCLITIIESYKYFFQTQAMSRSTCESLVKIIQNQHILNKKTSS